MKEKLARMDEMLDDVVEALYDKVMQFVCQVWPEETPEQAAARKRREDIMGALWRISLYGHPGKDPLFRLGE